MKLSSIEVVEDRTARSTCADGFLRLRRLLLRNHYSDGTRSAPYPCDVVSRARVDAVVAVLFERRGDEVHVLLRRSPRAPVYLRRERADVHPDEHDWTTLVEVVAGLLEEEDGEGPAAFARRASIEALEEAGIEVAPEQFTVLGGPTFASPGITDEKVYYAAAEVALDRRGAPRGDGSVMEEWSELCVLELGEALARCRSGEIPDMKTEVALGRLAALVEYGARGARTGLEGEA